MTLDLYTWGCQSLKVFGGFPTYRLLGVTLIAVLSLYGALQRLCHGYVRFVLCQPSASADEAIPQQQRCLKVSQLPAFRGSTFEKPMQHWSLCLPFGIPTEGLSNAHAIDHRIPQAECHSPIPPSRTGSASASTRPGCAGRKCSWAPLRPARAFAGAGLRNALSGTSDWLSAPKRMPGILEGFTELGITCT